MSGPLPVVMMSMHQIPFNTIEQHLYRESYQCHCICIDSVPKGHKMRINILEVVNCTVLKVSVSNTNIFK